MPKSKNPKSTQKPPARVRVPSAKAKASKETPAKQQQSSGKKSKKTKARNDMMGNEDELVNVEFHSVPEPRQWLHIM